MGVDWVYSLVVFCSAFDSEKPTIYASTCVGDEGTMHGDLHHLHPWIHLALDHDSPQSRFLYFSCGWAYILQVMGRECDI